MRTVACRSDDSCVILAPQSFEWVEWVLIGVPVCILSVLLTSAFACCCCGRRSYDKGYYASDVY